MANWRAKLVRAARWADETELRRFLTWFAIALVVRIEAFAESALDWDESVYVLMARSLLHGQAPYTAVWDHKPPGIYFLFALVELFGGSVMSIHVVTCVALAATAWAILSIWRTLFGGPSSRAWIAAAMFLGVVQRYGGSSTNTEHFFVALVALGLALLLPVLPISRPAAPRERAERPARLPRALLAGALWGVALQVKFVILVDVAFFLSLLWWSTRRPRAGGAEASLTTPARAPASPASSGGTPPGVERAGSILAPVLVGLALPSLAVVLFFQLRGAFHDYVYSNFLANVHHANDRVKLRGTLSFMAAILDGAPFLWGLALVAAPALHLAGAPAPRRALVNRLTLWLLMAAAAVLAPGQPYLHYGIQTALPLSLLAAAALDAVILSQLALRVHRGAVVAVVLFALYGGGVGPWIGTVLNLASRVVPIGPPHPDEVAAVASYLRPRLPAQDRLIYVVDWQPILYELTGADWPTRYLFPPFLADPHFVRVAGTEPGKELASILHRRPRYIVRRQIPEARYGAFRQLADATFAADYQLETVLDGIEILRRKSDAPVP